MSTAAIVLVWSQRSSCAVLAKAEVREKGWRGYVWMRPAVEAGLRVVNVNEDSGSSEGGGGWYKSTATRRDTDREVGWLQWMDESRHSEGV